MTIYIFNLILFLELHHDLYWIGATDSAGNNHFTWVDGSAVKHGDWSSNEPDGHDQDCVGMDGDANTPYTWHNKECNKHGNYICERI